ncbi:DUF4118 domain-containing protein [Jiangella alba]|uniref:Sensor protein KdpD transmembrane domain-containing protein n=1 Tax=Jiangella alba TaxID=561176 RepID=A0A1H5L2H8_9ACTN|nr:DUF4118 domain-containing protein [Jiangella alba]SEE70521.1 hypothetical protein SAMN04488561_2345 [Jiangella alba]
MDASPSRSAAVVMAVALLGPLVACAALTAVRDDVANANAALGLVLIVVGVAATGRRVAGVVAALSSAVWFDFFLTQPYQTFTIDDRDDIETAALLTVVGLAVTEIALWGRRQQARSSERRGYLDGIVSAARIVASGDDVPDELIRRVERQIIDVLDLDGCRYERGAGRQHAELHSDGTVTRRGRPVNVDRDGLPTDDEIELAVEFGGTRRGRFLLTAATAIRRPSLEQRLVAVTLAEQVGAALAAGAGREREPPHADR